MSFDKSWIDEAIIQSPSIKEAEWYIRGAKAFQEKAKEYYIQLADEFGTPNADITINSVLELLENLKA